MKDSLGMKSIVNYIKATLSGKDPECLYRVILFMFLVFIDMRLGSKRPLISASIILVGMTLITYFCRVVFIPHLYEKQKIVSYYLFSALAIAVLAQICVWLEINLLCDLDFIALNPVPSIVKYLGFIVSAFVITNNTYLGNKSRKNAAHAELMTLLNKEMELKYLKAQINPHFLFNALNNIYSMSYMKDDKAPESILRLSDMLRYVLDDCQSETVKIGKEIKYIKNFILFKTQCFEGERNITFTSNIENMDRKLPPMLLQPFVENCFKHSDILSNKNAFVQISLLTHNEEVHFVAQNSLPKLALLSETRNGIGIANIKKRLELLFQDQYTLNISETDVYEVDLHIKLSPEGLKQVT